MPKPLLPVPLAADPKVQTTFSAPTKWDESWSDIRKFEKWIQTQTDTVCKDLLCRLTLRLLPTVLIHSQPVVKGSGFEATLEAATEILAYQIEFSCGRPASFSPMSGGTFFDMCEGGEGIYVGTTWHAVESCADGFGPTFMKKYLSEVVANIRRDTPKDSVNFDRFFRAVIADCTAWEAWTRAGADHGVREKLLIAPLWTGSEPVDVHIEGLLRLKIFLKENGGPAHRVLLSIFDATGQQQNSTTISQDLSTFLVSRFPDQKWKGGDSNTLLTIFGNSLEAGSAEDALAVFSTFPDPNILTDMNWSALHYAASKFVPNVIGLLVQNGVDATIKSDSGWTAFHAAASGGHYDSLVDLLNCGVDPNQRCSYGRTALHYTLADRRRHDRRLSLFEYLIDHGADINVCDREEITPLDMAVDFGIEAEVGLLLMRGADPNARIGSDTCLHRLAEGGLPRSYFEMFLRAGAQTGLLNKDGERAYDIAMRRGRDDIVDLLK